MILKCMGSALIIVSCLGFGLLIAAFHRKEVSCLKGLICALDFMECELQYRMPDLPELCRRTAQESSGVLNKVFTDLACELENQICPDVKHCMDAVLYKNKDIPNETHRYLAVLGDSLGRFDLQGQLKALEFVRNDCGEKLKKLQGNAEVRLRSYRILGLCAGFALIILLM